MEFVKKIFDLNAKGVKLAFSVGTTVGGIVGCAAGLGLGVVVGMALAPKAGSEMLEDLSQKGCDALATAKDKVREFKDSSKEFYDDMVAKGQQES